MSIINLKNIFVHNFKNCIIMNNLKNREKNDEKYSPVNLKKAVSWKNKKIENFFTPIISKIALSWESQKFKKKMLK